MAEFAQLMINGLTTGVILAIAAAGVSLVYGVLRLVNFAAGDYITIGAFAGVAANVTRGLPFWISVLVAMVAVMALSWGLDFVLWRPLRKRKAGQLSLFLAAIGLALILRQLLLFFFGAESESFDVDVLAAYDLLGARVALTQIIAFGLGVVGLLLLWAVMGLSGFGRRMRAYADNAPLASVSGIDGNRVVRMTWLVSGALLGLTGVMQGLAQASFDTNMGWALLLPIFAAVVLGSVGNLVGAVVGGFALGLIMELSTWTALLGGVPGSYKPVVAFVLLALMLVFRPQGLFGFRERVV